MLTFKKTDFGDIPEIKRIISGYKEMTCENSGTSIAIWKNEIGFEYCIDEDELYTKLFIFGKTVFGLPYSKNMKKAVEKIFDYCKEKGYKPTFICPKGERFIGFESRFGEQFEFKEIRNSFEYIYDYASLSQLTGKKYHAKRNHISKFLSLYNWTYEELTKENYDEINELTEEWYGNKELTGSLLTEKEGIKEVMSHFDLLGIKGGILKVDGNPIAVTFGTEINDEVFDVAFEKALPEYEGAYTFINNQFVNNTLKGYKFINREDDMGIEGLRKAKLSYYPAVILEKYIAELKENDE